VSPPGVCFVCDTGSVSRTAANENLYAVELVSTFRVHIANQLFVWFSWPLPPLLAKKLRGVYGTTHRGPPAVGDFAVSQLRVRHESRELIPQHRETRISAGQGWRPPGGVSSWERWTGAYLSTLVGVFMAASVWKGPSSRRDKPWCPVNMRLCGIRFRVVKHAGQRQ